MPTTSIAPTPRSRFSWYRNGPHVLELITQKNIFVPLETARAGLDSTITSKARLATAARTILDPAGTSTAITIRPEAKLTTAQETAISNLRTSIRTATTKAELSAAFMAFTGAFGSNIPLDVSDAFTRLNADPFDPASKADITAKERAASTDFTNSQASKRTYYGYIREVLVPKAASWLPTPSTTPPTGRLGRLYRWSVDRINQFAQNQGDRANKIKDAALRASLLEICKMTVPVREELDAQDALKKYDTDTYDPQKKIVADAAVNAFLEVGGLKKNDFKVARDIYDGLEDLRGLWDVEPDINLIDTSKYDYGAKDVFGKTNQKFKIKTIRQWRDRDLHTDKALVFTNGDPTNPKSIIATERKVKIHGKMDHAELAAILLNQCQTWKTNGLVIRTNDREEAIRIAAVLDSLATDPAYKHCAKYTLKYGSSKFLWKTTFHGAQAEVGWWKSKLGGKKNPLSASRTYSADYVNETTPAAAAATLARASLTSRNARAAAGAPTISPAGAS